MSQSASLQTPDAALADPNANEKKKGHPIAQAAQVQGGNAHAGSAAPIGDRDAENSFGGCGEPVTFCLQV